MHFSDFWFTKNMEKSLFLFCCKKCKKNDAKTRVFSMERRSTSSASTIGKKIGSLFMGRRRARAKAMVISIAVRTIGRVHCPLLARASPPLAAKAGGKFSEMNVELENMEHKKSLLACCFSEAYQ